MKWFGFGGKNELPPRDEMTPKDQAMMEVGEKKEKGGMIQILFDPVEMKDKVKLEENGLVLLENVDLYAITPGILAGQDAPSKISVLLSGQQYGQMLSAAKGRSCEVNGIIKSTDERATVATEEALGQTGYKKETSEIPTADHSDEVMPRTKAPEGKEEIPV